MSDTRAKFVVDSITHRQDGDGEVRDIKMSAVTGGSEENDSFFKYTPKASLNLSTINEGALADLKAGQKCYVDILPID